MHFHKVLYMFTVTLLTNWGPFTLARLGTVRFVGVHIGRYTLTSLPF